jgi:hypothetical protein
MSTAVLEFDTTNVCDAGAAPPQVAGNDSAVGATTGPPPMALPDSEIGEGSAAHSAVVALVEKESEPTVAPECRGWNVSDSCSTLGVEPVAAGRLNEGTSSEKGDATPESMPAPALESTPASAPASRRLAWSVATSVTEAGALPVFTTQKFCDGPVCSKTPAEPKAPKFADVVQPDVVEVPKARTAPCGSSVRVSDVPAALESASV